MVKIDYRTHEKKLTYFAFIVGIVVCLYFNPMGVGEFWALAIVCLLIWYGWMSKRRKNNGTREGF